MGIEDTSKRQSLRQSGFGVSTLPSVLRLLAICVSLVALGAAAKATPAAKSVATVDCNFTGFEAVLSATPNIASAKLPARAYWLNRQLLKWPGVAASGNFRLYHSADGRITATQGATVQGADGVLGLSDPHHSRPVLFWRVLNTFLMVPCWQSPSAMWAKCLRY